MYVWDIRPCQICHKPIALLIDSEEPTTVYCPCGAKMEVTVEEDDGGEDSETGGEAAAA